MTRFDKLFKTICEEYTMDLVATPTERVEDPEETSPDGFPLKFTWVDEIREFIFDTLPSLGYKWHTLDDLKNIPELVSALEHTNTDVLIDFYGSLYSDIVDRKDLDNSDEEVQDTREIAKWIKDIALGVTK